MAENIKNQNLEDDEMFVTLDLDDGSQVECEILTIFEVNKQDYIALLPLVEEGDDEEGEVFLYRYIETEDSEPTLANIEDDDEYEAVADAFDEWLDEQEFEELEDEE